MVIALNFQFRNYLMQKPEQELGKQKKLTKQQKKKYLEFVTNRLISLEGRAPNNFFVMMSNQIQNCMTPRRWSGFHKYRKQGCQSMIDLIKKVSNEIDQDPAVFIKNHEETIKRQNDKMSCFEGLEKTKPIAKVVLQEFLKDFNPYEIIFKPHENFSNQMLGQGKKSALESSDAMHYRRLEQKLYPVKDEVQYSDQEKEKSDNQAEAQEFLGQDFRSKKQIIFEKRKQKKEQKPIPTLQQNSWTDAQYLKFLVFLTFYKCQFSNDPSKKNIGLTVKMSKFIKTRDIEGCSSCWQYFLRKCKDINGVISYFQRTINVSKQQIYDEIRNIQEFYQEDLQREMVSLSPVKLFLWAPGCKNYDLVHQIIKSKIQFSSLTKEIDKCQLEADQESLKVQNSQITIELPIMFEVFLIKQIEQVLKKSNPNQKGGEKNIHQKKEYEDEDEYEDQNGDQDNINKKKHDRRNKAFDKTNKKQRKSQEIYFQDDDIKGNKYVQKINKAKITWSISQNIKLVAYLIVNRYYFENIDVKERFGIITKLTQYLQTGKSVANCSDHLSHWKLKNDKDINQVIEQKAQKFGLTEQIVEERKKICREIKTVKTKIGDATLQLDHLPTKILINKGDQSVDKILTKIYESQPFLSFYLRFKENHQIEAVDQENKKFERQQCTEEKEQIPLKVIKLTLKLAVPKQQFQQLKNQLEKNLKKDQQTLNLYDSNNQIKIEVCSKIIYKCLFI